MIVSVDLPTIAWLQDYLCEETEDLMVLFVTHDRLDISIFQLMSFVSEMHRSMLDTVCTDIIEFRDQRLIYFPGTYSDWLRNTSEMSVFHQHRLENQSRKEEQLKKALEHTKSSNIARKLDRAGMHRAIDGKKFKNFSLKKISEDAVHLCERENVEFRNKDVVASNHFSLPKPDIISLRLSTPDMPVISMTSCNIQWTGGDQSAPLLKSITLDIPLGARLAIVGCNGQGKPSDH